jgi:hypothetical protein
MDERLMSTDHLIAWADTADKTLTEADDYYTAKGADVLLTAAVRELRRRANAGDVAAALWLQAGRPRN